MKKIFVIGESCKDIFHYGVCTRLCPEAPAPVFNSLETRENAGMAMNVYNNIKSLGIRTEILTNENWTQVTKTRFVEKRSNHMFMRLDQGDDSIVKCDFSTVNFSAYDAIVVSDYNKGFLSTDQLREISLMHPVTFLDTKKILGKWCKNYSFIKINGLEYERTTDTINEEIKKKLIVTMGPRGALANGKRYSVPMVEVKDTSGAGDSFLAALSVCYCRTKDIEKSIDYANECATQVVQKRGVSLCASPGAP